MTWTDMLSAPMAEITGSEQYALVCDYLKTEPGDDDRVLTQCIRAAVGYIVNAVGLMPEDDPSADALLLALVQNLYDDRELMQSDIQQKKSFEYTFRSFITQLQLVYGEEA